MAIDVELTQEDFYFDSPINPIEDISLYVPGGYHPIIIGTVLSPEPCNSTVVGPRQYRIIHKLGFGSNSTVWLAQKTDSQAFVAIKVNTADASATTNEAEILQEAHRRGPSPHILELLDHFTIHGPNGVHLVLVTDIAVPLVMTFGMHDLPTLLHWRKAVVRGLVQAVADLHAAGVVHGGTTPTFIVKCTLRSLVCRFAPRKHRDRSTGTR